MHVADSLIKIIDFSVWCWQFGHLSKMFNLREFFLVWILLPLLLSASDDAKRLFILANSESNDSMLLARYYAGKRAIPKENIIALPMPDKETISIKEYVDAIHNPLLDRLLERGLIMGVKADGKDAYGRNWLVAGLHEMSYLVSMYGVPLRISNDAESIPPASGQIPENFRFNRGSVDSELALIAMPGRRSMTAYSPNPFFENKTPSVHLFQTCLRVSRLDGPDIRSVESLIERSLEAEAKGLQGRAYFDLGGPHASGDEWFRLALERVREAYFDNTVESSKRLLDERDRFDAPAIYMGWYTHHAYGNFKIPNWNVPAGAIALHLHSFSGTSLRSAGKYWLGPLVKMGFCATVGNVYEPYLQFTHHPHRLLEYLLEGGTFGAAVAYSIPAYSWMGVAIGDPLYRPFKKKPGAQGGVEDSPYVVLREVNRIDANGSADTATLYLRGVFQRFPSLPLAHALASRYADAGKNKQAMDVLRLMQYIQIYAKEDRVLVQKLADLIGRLKQPDQALQIYEKLLDERDLAKSLRLSLLEGAVTWATAAGKQGSAGKWSQQILMLQEPTKAKIN